MLVTVSCAGVIVVMILVMLLWTIRSKKTGAKPKAESPDDKDGSEGIGGADYKLITEKILQLGGKTRSVLFAATGFNCLPITIPVNVAIQLAGQKKRCLLIDLDLKRDAVAKAFNLVDKPDPEDLRPKPYKTPFENLLVWPAHNFTKTKQMNVKPLVQAAVGKFDLVLINAPYLEGSPDRMQIVSAAQCGIIFTQNSTQATRLTELMKTTQCKLISNIQAAVEKS